MNGVHAETSPPALYVPAGQSLQSLSLVELPMAKRNCPAAQGVNAVHIAALVVVLNPMLQLAHTRSVVAVPFVMTN